MEATADRLAEAFDPGGALPVYPPLVPDEWLDVPFDAQRPALRVAACHFPKPGVSNNTQPRGTRDLYLLEDLLTAAEVDELCALAEKVAYDTVRVEPVDRRPACMSSVISGGRYVCSAALERKLRPIIEERLLPFARKHFGCLEAVPCTSFVRRYTVPEGRAGLQPHFDGNAIVTINVGLADPGEFEGGMYVQPTADAASRVRVPLRRGGVLMHSYDLLHGVAVASGVRRSLIVWLRDSAEACEADTCPWYARDAALGDADAQLNLAEHHRAGTGGVVKDLSLALSLYEQAARQGHPIAQFKLGMLQESTDAAAALRWWRLAAAQGYAKAQRRLGEHEDAARWLQAAAQQDDNLAMYELYRHGGCKGSAPLAWLVRAARHGHPGAQHELALQALRSSETPSAGLVAAAFGWLLRGADGGEHRSRALLAGLLLRPPAGRASLASALVAYCLVCMGKPAATADEIWAAGVCGSQLEAALPLPLEEDEDLLVVCAWACARCGACGEQARLAAAAVQLSPRLRAEQLALLLWSLASLSVHLPLGPLWPRLPACLAALGPAALARATWALATLPGARPLPAAVAEALASAASEHAGELCAEDLANLTWALARLRCGEACAGRLLAAACARASELNLNELANVTWALASLGLRGQEVEPLAAAARCCPGSDAALRTRLEWGLAALRASDGSEPPAEHLEEVYDICWSDHHEGARALLQGLLA